MSLQATASGSTGGFASCGSWPLSVCSWSLRTDPFCVAQALSSLDIGQVNLALKPALLETGAAYMDAVRRQPWSVSAMTIGFFHEDYTSLASIRATGGIVPDEHWDRNRDMVLRALEISADFGVPFLTFHAGFIEEHDPARAARFRDRLAALADAAAGRGVTLLMETGQESAACLRTLWEDLGHPALGVHFDPANMILYGKGDPVGAVHLLGRWIRHVHIKDARAAEMPGTWGTEVPWGEGEVGGEAFLNALKEAGYSGALAIERESGDDRLRDIRLAAERLQSYTPQTRGHTR